MIDIIIPAFNREKTISRSIESVLAQTRTDWELTVVDDCSTDGTKKAVQGYSDPRIHYQRLDKNSGVHAARNRGIEVTKGEFLVFFDSDDELYTHALERLKAPMSDETIGMVSAPYKLPDGSLTSFDRVEGKIPFQDLICNRSMRPNKASITMFRRSAIGEMRWFEKNLDFVFFRRVASRSSQYHIPEPLAAYHTQKGGTKNSMTAARRIPNPSLSVARGKVLADFVDEFAEYLKNCPTMYGFYAYGASVGLLLSGDAERSRKFARAAFMHQPRAKYLFFYAFSILPGSHILLRRLFDFKRYLFRRA